MNGRMEKRRNNVYIQLRSSVLPNQPFLLENIAPSIPELHFSLWNLFFFSFFFHHEIIIRQFCILFQTIPETLIVLDRVGLHHQEGLSQKSVFSGWYARASTEKRAQNSFQRFFLCNETGQKLNSITPLQSRIPLIYIQRFNAPRRQITNIYIRGVTENLIVCSFPRGN